MTLQFIANEEKLKMLRTKLRKI